MYSARTDTDFISSAVKRADAILVKSKAISCCLFIMVLLAGFVPQLYIYRTKKQYPKFVISLLTFIRKQKTKMHIGDRQKCG